MNTPASAEKGLRIGLEIHARLRTRSKAFCTCANDVTVASNTNVCPVCLGLPGTLPVVNRRMIEVALLAGMALDADVHRSVAFSRKLYSYPDLPKGYQITQFEHPLFTGGVLRFRVAHGAVRELRLWRLHVEEDAAKLTHRDGEAIVDYNRCGIPLLEIVTAPDLKCADDAVAAARELRRILLFLGVCDGKMEAGSFRCDVNVSYGVDTDTGRSEIKNLNSFAAIRDAINWEGHRLANAMRMDPRAARTIHWDEGSASGTIMRTKEREYEYRYAPEPDLPPITITEEMLAHCRDGLCELPLDLETRFRQQYALPPGQAAFLCAEPDAAEYFEETLAAFDAASPERAALTARWMQGELTTKRDAYGGGWQTFALRPAAFADLLLLILHERLSDTAAKRVVHEMLTTGAPAEVAATRLGAMQISDENFVDRCILEGMRQHDTLVTAWRAGRTKVFTALMGEIMRLGEGRLNPRLTAQRLTLYLHAADDTESKDGMRS
ncbi:MAG: Asp-tRNA(Asn)/Glu-tRNA(Gln) amidotransferase subunit GatB [Bacteroidia bacterium]|nr:Asp-tRNA(Asn)/Glu-tRNA(Gln) amidotransferase subunit GatB [Bacteroidia bacterium]